MKKLRVWYEGAPCGYVLYWLTMHGNPLHGGGATLIPAKAGDWVKTDRRDAEKKRLARANS
jgi:hypothetical protein